MSYNVLKMASGSLTEDYPRCPPEYLDFKYRRILLVHEIKSKLFNRLLSTLIIYIISFYVTIRLQMRCNIFAGM